MKWPEIVANNWKDFDNIITQMIDHGRLLKERFFFRGQSADWPLFPSFTRILNQTEGYGFLLAPFEAVVVKKFMSTARQHLLVNLVPTDDDIVGWWQLMQHYRAPTRLLDWTSSPYVAAYFAVIEHLERDGFIWVMNYSCLEKAVDAEIKKERCSTTESDTWYVRNLPQSINFIRAIDKNHSNPRAVVQQAELTYTINVFSDHGLIIQSLLDNNINSTWENKSSDVPLVERKYFKIVIPKESKRDYLARLHTANISASSLFPGLDGVGAAIKEEIDWQIHVAIKSNSKHKDTSNNPEN
ncbi:MAG: FRG domain-containing protein [Planctomycetaceae bacterium]|nr:FRG domain-containing protein [Planctomycetaceae bacterium]